MMGTLTIPFRVLLSFLVLLYKLGTGRPFPFHHGWNVWVVYVRSGNDVKPSSADGQDTKLYAIDKDIHLIISFVTSNTNN